jgi:CheY-like chemotaxis protein
MPNQIKILLAEDDRFLRKAYELSLKKEGLEVITAVDGLEAYEKAKSEQPQLILLDIVMPKKNGFETLMDLKKDPLTQSIPIIIMSNSEGVDSNDKPLELGAVECILKAKISIKDLVAKIRQYI